MRRKKLKTNTRTIEAITKRDELRKIYETGRGTFKLRGTYTIEEGARGSRSFVINTMPYGVEGTALTTAIADIITARKIPHAVDVRNEASKGES